MHRLTGSLSRTISSSSMTKALADRCSFWTRGDFVSCMSLAAPRHRADTTRSMSRGRPTTAWRNLRASRVPDREVGPDPEALRWHR